MDVGNLISGSSAFSKISLKYLLVDVFMVVNIGVIIIENLIKQLGIINCLYCFSKYLVYCYTLIFLLANVKITSSFECADISIVSVSESKYSRFSFISEKAET